MREPRTRQAVFPRRIYDTDSLSASQSLSHTSIHRRENCGAFQLRVELVRTMIGSGSEKLDVIADPIEESALLRADPDHALIVGLSPNSDANALEVAVRVIEATNPQFFPPG